MMSSFWSDRTPAVDGAAWETSASDEGGVADPPGIGGLTGVVLVVTGINKSSRPASGSIEGWMGFALDPASPGA